MSNFLIIGSAGMAGHMVYTYLKERGQTVFGIDLHQNGFSVDQVVDTGDWDQLKKAIQLRPFDYVINCGAILGQPLLDHPELAKRIDSEMPHQISRFLEGTSGKLIHISTDFVFSGSRSGGGYLEADSPDNETPYGLYKRGGEVYAPNAINLRLSIIGPTPLKTIPNYLNNVIESESPSLWGLTNAYWTGITTLELAKTILVISHLPNQQNIYHLCSRQKETRYQTIQNIMNIFAISKPLEPREGEPKDYSLISTHLAFRKPFEAQIQDLRQWMIDHPFLYGHYLCLQNH
jgi:dTDP-4-dehydrorhamnose reductase